ncbi:MAG: hypothetical protein ACI8XI_000228 [Woeseiaceae bacterium]|jgi:hypothetical protein|tara:strand:- start:23464 stop:23895 length:432 start_codon:yes stop_codon:yes gene_type:complete
MNARSTLFFMALLAMSSITWALEQTEDSLEVIPPTETNDTQAGVTVQEFADLLKMSSKDFDSLLAAAEIEVLGPDDIVGDDKKIILMKFLKNLPEIHEFDNTDCKPDEMLFCETERRVSDQRFGRNKMASDKLCACGPMAGRF